MTSAPAPEDADRAMDRYADGDEAAFAVVYDQVAPRLTAYLRRQVRDRARADDIIQQVFLHMHRARATFIRGTAVLPWAFAIARRLLIDGARHRRVTPTCVPWEANAGRVASPSLEDRLIAREVLEQIEDQLGRLPASQREAFALLKQEGLSVREAARVLGTTVAAVKLRAHRALATLRSLLERDAGMNRSRERQS